MATTELKIAASADDAYENVGTGATNIVNTLIYLCSSASNFSAGFRFQNVPIPKGATINSAILSVYAYSATYDDASLKLYFEAADSAAAFTTGAGDISSRVKTTEGNAVAWTATGIAEGGFAFYNSPDLAAALQEVVDRAGWAAGNSLAVLTSDPAQNTDFRVRSWDTTSSNTYAAKLNIDYTEEEAIEWLAQPEDVECVAGTGAAVFYAECSGHDEPVDAVWCKGDPHGENAELENDTGRVAWVTETEGDVLSGTLTITAPLNEDDGAYFLKVLGGGDYRTSEQAVLTITGEDPLPMPESVPAVTAGFLVGLPVTIEYADGTEASGVIESNTNDTITLAGSLTRIPDAGDVVLISPMTSGLWFREQRYQRPAAPKALYVEGYNNQVGAQLMNLDIFAADGAGAAVKNTEAAASRDFLMEDREIGDGRIALPGLATKALMYGLWFRPVGGGYFQVDGLRVLENAR